MLQSIAINGLISRITAYAMLFAGFALMILIGQRMPMLLLLCSLCLTGLVVRRFRWPIAIALAAIVMEALLRIFQRVFVPWQGHD